MGLAIAHQLASHGASLWIMARNEQHLQATAQQLRQAGAKNVSICRADLNDPLLFDCIRRQVGNVTFRGVLLNGGGPHGGADLSFTSQDYDDAHALLLRGPALLLQALAPQIERKKGSVVSISSTTVRELNPDLPLSGAYRAGFAALLKAFAEQLGREGIRVNSIAPGYVRTEKLQDLQRHVAHERFGNIERESMQKIEEEWAALAPLNRLLQPSEIASVCMFLFSSASSSMTGQTLLADAGQLRCY